MLVGYVLDVPEEGTLQIGAVNLDESEVVCIRLALNQSTSVLFYCRRNRMLTDDDIFQDGAMYSKTAMVNQRRRLWHILPLPLKVIREIWA